MIDERQKRTRNAVFTALDQLLGESPYQDINVKTLAARAGVGRQTFYRHFEGIDAVVHAQMKAKLDAQMDFARSQSQECTPQEWLKQVTKSAFDTASEQPHLVQLVLRGDAGADVIAQFRQHIIDLWSLAGDDTPVGAIDSEMLPFVASFKAGAMSAMLLHWIESDCKPDATTMSDLFHALVTSDKCGGMTLTL